MEASDAASENVRVLFAFGEAGTIVLELVTRPRFCTPADEGANVETRALVEFEGAFWSFNFVMRSMCFCSF